jgi:peptidyl-prolyl isomerase D
MLIVAWPCPPLLAKALYRQGLAQVMLNDYDEAEKVILEAHSLAKDDKAIAAELERLRQRKKAQRDKEKAAYKKMFD